jgi:hypothetical protein
MAAAPMNARMFQTFIATALAAGHIGLTLKFQKPDAPDSREGGKGRGRVKKRTVPISGRSVRSWGESYSDRGSVDPQSLLGQTH